MPDPNYDPSDMVDQMGGSSKKKDRSKTSRAVGSAGADLNRSSVQQLQELARSAGERSVSEQSSAPRYMDVPSFKRGGTMKKTGRAKVHKSEMIGRSKRKRGRSSGR